MTQTTRPPFPPFTPPSAPLRERTSIVSRIRREINAMKPSDIVIAVIAIATAAGFTINSPMKKLAANTVADSALTIRVTANEKAIAALGEQQRFTNYMLCVSARRNDPASAPPDCAPIIEARKAK